MTEPKGIRCQVTCQQMGLYIQCTLVCRLFSFKEVEHWFTLWKDSKQLPLNYICIIKHKSCCKNSDPQDTFYHLGKHIQGWMSKAVPIIRVRCTLSMADTETQTHHTCVSHNYLSCVQCWGGGSLKYSLLVINHFTAFTRSSHSITH